MVNQEMAIVAQPRKIFRFIIHAVSINVVDDENTLILCPAYFAHLFTARPFEQITVHTSAMLPICMLLAHIELVTPQCLASFRAKIFTTL